MSDYSLQEDDPHMTITREPVRDISQRLKYEIFGAWRAGYDYVHYYMDSSPGSGGDPLEMRLRLTYYVLPSNTKERPDPDGLRYVETFVLKDLDPEEVREAW